MADRGEGAAGGRYGHGSGCLIGGTTVLTAAHVVAGARSVTVRRSDLQIHEAKVDLVGDPGQWGPDRFPGPDLALMTVLGAAGWDVPRIECARVDRGHPSGLLERARAVGYPQFATRPPDPDLDPREDDRRRVWVQVPVAGAVLLADREDRLLDLQVTIAPPTLIGGASSWAGMSGAPVTAGGRLVGVVGEHARGYGSSTLAVIPLTALDADPGHPSRSTGTPDADSWWARLGVSARGDLLVLPPAVEAPYWATVRDEIGYGLHQRMPLLVAREQELAQLSGFAAGPPGYQWWKGGAYAGKSALLHELVTSGAMPDQVAVVAYFVRARSFDADEGRFLDAVVPQLELLCSETVGPDRTLNRFHQLWQRACAGGRPVLLVVDALDEDLRPAGSAPIAARLPRLLGARGHVLVSSRLHPDIQTWVESTHPLVNCPQVDLAPFEGSAELADQAAAEIDAIATGDDADILALLTAAGGALSIRDLAELVAFPKPATPATRRRVRELVAGQGVARSLEPVGSIQAPRYQFAHELLVQHARTHTNLADPGYRQRIHGWAERWRDRGWPTEGTPRYLVDTYSATLLGDPQHPALFPPEPERHARLLSDIGWIDTAIRTVGVEQVRAALQSAPHSSRIRQARAVLGAQASDLGPGAMNDRGFVFRQFGVQALWFRLDELAQQCASQLMRGGCQGVPVWSTSRSQAPPDVELGGHPRTVTALAVLHDGRIVSAGDFGQLRVWDPAQPGSPLELGSHDHDGWVEAVAELPDGHIVSAGDGLIQVWDPARPGTPLEDGLAHGLSVWAWSLAASPEGWVVSGGDGLIQVWDPAQPGSPLEVGCHDDSLVESVAWLPDGRVVSAGSDGRIRVWDLHGGAPLDLNDHDVWGPVTVSPDGRVVSAGSDGRVLIWDCAHPGAPIELGRHDGRLVSVAVLADGRVVGGSADGRILVWDPARPSSPLTLCESHSFEVTAVAALPDGRVVSGDGAGRVRIWDPAQPRVPLGPDDHDPWSAMALLPGGRVVSGDRSGRVRVWGPGQPGTPLELGCHEDSSVSALAVLPDGRVVSATYHGVRLWDPAQLGFLLELGDPDGSQISVAVSPDGRVVCGYHSGRLQVCDPGEPGATLELSGPAEPGWAVHTVAVLPDGRVVSGGNAGVRVWDLACPGRPLQLGSYGDLVLSVAGLPDGRVLSGANDGRVRVWDPAQPDTPLELGSHDDSVLSVAGLPDGRVISGSRDGRVRVWDPAQPDTPVAEIALHSPVHAIAAGVHAPVLVGIVTGSGAELLAFSNPEPVPWPEEC